MEHISIALRPVILSALTHIARAEATSVDALIASAIRADLDRRGTERANAAIRRAADGPPAAPLRHRLGALVAHAQGWGDVQAGLHAKGYRLTLRAGRVMVLEAQTQTVAGALTDIVRDEAALVRRFGISFADWVALRSTRLATASRGAVAQSGMMGPADRTG
ncbi:MAG: hypothetical protein ABNH26_03625 [Celeribacter sp.]|jgi:hypothetical protein